MLLWGALFQSTSPVWGMTKMAAAGAGEGFISIHIPRVGDDSKPRSDTPGLCTFQSTSPVWGMTRFVRIRRMNPLQFQSTSPVWGMTICALISVIVGGFQSTSPVWGMTAVRVYGFYGLCISIHIPRVGDDDYMTYAPPDIWSHFNPHPPCGG